ncbi:MAG: WecB/TagA/CpsF family glycosyltransferase [Pseudomonadota bacterium]
MRWSKDSTVDVNVASEGTLMADLRARLNDRTGFSVATLNLDHVVKLNRDRKFREAYQAQTHVTADGNPIVWLSRLSGQNVSLIPGSELVSPIAGLAAEIGAPLGLFGAADASLSAASDALRAQHPGLAVVYCEAPPMGFDPDGSVADEAISRIAKSGARVVFLALGAPKQECFAARAQKALPGVGFLSIGAGLDFVSGAQVRAPRWVRRIAAEWLWRLVADPRRLGSRYLACALAMPGLTTRALSERLR